MVGAALRCERHHQRAQQLALARTGGACDEAVRSVAYEVDVDDAIARHPESCDRGRVAPRMLPAADDHARRVVGHRFQLRQRHVARDAARLVVVLGVDQRANRRAAASAVDTDTPATVISRSSDVQGEPSASIHRAARRPQLEDPVDDRRHRRIRGDECDARDIASFQPAAHRPGAGAEQRRHVEHHTVRRSVAVAVGPVHGCGQRHRIVGGDHAVPATGVRQPAGPPPTIGSLVTTWSCQSAGP